VNQEKDIIPRKFIPALTGLRAICAYGIFFYHINPFAKERQNTLYRIVDQFYSFIPFFFVISGFVIFYNYYKPSRFTKNELFNYFISRVARIFPILIILNFLVFLFCYKENIYTGLNSIALFLLNITLLKGFFSEYFLTGIGPSWTNSVEEVFYLLAPLLFFFSKQRLFLLKFILIFYFFGFLFTCFFIEVPFYSFLNSFKFTAYFTFFGRVFEFASGIYLAMVFMGIYKNKYLEKIGAASLLIGILLLVFSYALLYYISIHYHVGHANEVWQGIIVNNFIFPVAIFFILYNLLYYKNILQKLLSTKIMVSLGNATYSFYLLHTTFVLSFIYKYLSKNAFVAFIAMAIISFFFFKLIEQPIAKFLKSKLYRKHKIN
jgi:peptidoglycan/LPS O-acetylase OafA/YrhL